MKRLLSLTAVVLMAAGCGGTKTVDDFRAGVPDKGSVNVTVPAKQNAVIGQVATWYGITAISTGVINGSVVAILDIVHAIVQQNPTSHTGNQYVWGPGNGGPLDPVMWRLTVTDNGDDSFTYKLDGRKKSDPDTAFVTVLTGTHTPVINGGKSDPNHGSGSFHADWDAYATLPHLGDPNGAWDVSYDHRTGDVKVDVKFSHAKNDQGQRVDSTYHFNQIAGGDGLFQFATVSDVDHTSPALENTSVESRWQQSGAGRADIHVTGGDLGTTKQGAASECWDSNFIENYVFFSAQGDATATYSEGNAAGCVFSSAAYYDGN